MSAACGQDPHFLRYQDGRSADDLNGGMCPQDPHRSGGNAASVVSATGLSVRRFWHYSKIWQRQADVIMDGRDIGTCVLPDTDPRSI